MILVTGGTGFVGRRVVAELRRRGKDVRALVRDPRTDAARSLQDAGVQLVAGDVTDEAGVMRSAAGADAIVHLVAVIRERGPATFAAINYRGTLRVLDAARGAGVARVLHVSALGADPSSAFPYLRSKGLAEEAVRQSGTAYTIVRPSVIFGESDEFVRTLAALVKALPVVPIVGDGNARFQPIWVGDVATAIARLLEDTSGAGQTYDLAGLVPLTYAQLVDVVSDTLGIRRPRVHLPPSLVEPVAAAMSRLLPAPPVTPGQLALLQVPNVSARSATPALLGHPPRPLPGSVDYVKRLTYRQALRAVLGLGLPEVLSAED